MAACPELVLGVEELPLVRGKGFLNKRSSGLIKSWSYRYVVINANFLYMFSTQSDNKPRKVVCLDGAAIQPAPEAFKGKPFTFQVVTRKGKTYNFSAETQEQVDEWMKAMRLAPYESLTTRLSSFEVALQRLHTLLMDGAATNAGAGAGVSESKAGPESDAVPKRPPARIDIGALVDAVRHLQRRAAAGEQAVKQLESHGSEAAEIDRVASMEVNRRLVAALADVESLQAEVARLKAEPAHTPMATPTGITPEEHAAAVATLEARLTDAQVQCRQKDDEIAHLQRRLADSEALLSSERARLLAQVASLEAALKAAPQAGSGAGRGGAASADSWEPASATPAPGASSPPPAISTSSPPRPVPALTKSPVSASFPGERDGKSTMSSKDPYEHEWAPFYKEGQALEKAGRLAEAEQQYQMVLDIRRERNGSDSVGVATASRDLGRVLALQRRFDRAEEHYQEAVGLCTSLLGESHPNTACALTDLAAVQREQGKFHQAEKHAERAVHSLRLGVGPEDVSTATALYNLAGLAKRQGKYRIAEQSYAEALGIFRKKLGDGEGETADTMYQMGCLYRKRNEYSQAREYFLQASSAYAKAYGSTDRRVEEANKRAASMADKLAARGGGGRPPSGSRRRARG